MGFRISFTLVLTLLTLVLSLVPAIIIWVVFMDLMTSSVDLLKGTTQNATNTMAQRIQELLMSEAMANLDARLTEGDEEVLVQQAMIQSSGLLNYDLRPSRFDVQRQFLTPFYSRNFATMKGHPYFCGVNTMGVVYRNGTDTVAQRVFWLTWIQLFTDIYLHTSGNSTLYVGTLLMSPDEKTEVMNSTYVNQTTAAPVYLLSSTKYPSSAMTMTFAPSGWDKTLGFNQYSGQVQFSKWYWLPAQNDTWIQVSLSLSAQTISGELKAQLSDSPADRLVLFFRQQHGYMIAASHGKFYSHSDVDRRYINPLTNPPNISAYRLWNCMQSTDGYIQQACQQLYDTYQSWPAIPALRREAVLSGQRYWVSTSIGSSSLNCMVLMLKSRASVMAAIDAGNVQVDDSVANKKTVTFIILGVISAIAVLLPLAVGLWLASRLYKLAAGMDRIAQLQFTQRSTPRSMFQELHRFETSFVQMERGLQAFGKFVPQAVVRVMVAGHMSVNDEMHPETLTIMFADIEGFSAVCENVSPKVLVAVCTEYFETVCSIITQRHGTIDKFIGDCIMALWNAPEQMPGHEKDAVGAALAMQASVLQLHSAWQTKGLPLLKFRLGIHTGVCLVGNFGCSYRISYTCLGDGVNLSARLEPLNKKFGTYLCVSHATYQGCCRDFRFRRLGKVTVPGKTEVLPVYEVLCEADGSDSSKLHTFKSLDLPGCLESDDAVEMLSTDSSRASVPRDTRGRSPVKPTALPVPSEPKPTEVPYHWAYVDRAAMLAQAAEYELAYEALVAGNLVEAEQLLRAEPLLDIPDPAWATLADQLAQCAAGKAWDGVFRFATK